MSVTFQPLGANCVVTLAPEAERSTVLHVVKEYSDTARTGTVAAIGPEVTRVAVGDQVWLSTLAGTELGVGDGQTLVLPETSILAILEPSTAAPETDITNERYVADVLAEHRTARKGSRE